MIDLLPCPFCGGKAGIYDAEAEYDGEFSGHVVMCEACGCGTIAFTTQDKAISAWNNRSISDKENSLIKVLASIIDAHFDASSAEARNMRAIYQASELLKSYAD